MAGRQAARNMRLPGALTLSVIAGWLCVTAAYAQSPTPSQSDRQNELRGVADTLRRSEAEQARLRSEIAGLKSDRAKLNVELLKSAEQVRQTEERIAASEARLAEVVANEEALRRSLESRKETIVEVLAALQRMGRKPPPAVIVRPEDMREAIRAAILLGYVLPEIRNEAEKLVSDLGELARLRQAGETERRKLTLERDTIKGERSRLVALVDVRQSQIEGSEKALTSERARIDGLARQSQSLRDLISRAEAENDASLKALDQARRPGAAGDVSALDAGVMKDAAKLQPRIQFSEARGAITLPVSGQIEKLFGASDGFGGTERGITIAAAAEAIVTAPSDGWVLFAGPYRSYGRVLIINAGGGYNFVLTGLQHTSVEIGQFILAGEPVGSMGLADKTGESVQRLPLYVELRKDNQPIDPSPWWVRMAGDRATPEKARG